MLLLLQQLLPQEVLPVSFDQTPCIHPLISSITTRTIPPSLPSFPRASSLFRTTYANKPRAR